MKPKKCVYCGARENLHKIAVCTYACQTCDPLIADDDPIFGPKVRKYYQELSDWRAGLGAGDVVWLRRYGKAKQAYVRRTVGSRAMYMAIIGHQAVDITMTSDLAASEPAIINETAYEIEHISVLELYPSYESIMEAVDIEHQRELVVMQTKLDKLKETGPQKYEKCDTALTPESVASLLNTHN